ncbi:DDRGK domain-containing protein 1-like [Rana temporaria]|uniref:DDRGK domain-containing protein 1-like n=1 Tax=Rana temporaria TaxID=8407 RepID=UPI001AACC476|nr:DDRGK domain-containing protein 1-like [Rana temporaria]
MDPVLYIVAALLLAVLLYFTARIRGHTEQADHEDQQNVVAAAAARPRFQPEERGDGMPRRRMNRGMMAQRQARRMEEEREGTK